MVIKSRIQMRVGILAVVLLILPCLAQSEYGAAQSPDQRATETAQKIQQSLDQILGEISQMKIPSQSDISASERMLEGSRRYFSQMDDKQQAQYCLLQSWVAYYSNNIEDAHRNALKACKLDATSGDAWATQLAMALLADTRPMLPRPPRPVRTPRTRPGQGGMESPEMMRGGQDAAGQVQKGRLDFDLNLFLGDAVGKKIEPLQLSCLNGTTFSYRPGSEALCMLLWRKFEDKIPVAGHDPNQGGGMNIPPMTVEPRMMEGEMMMGGEGYGYGQTQEGTPIAAFGKLFETGVFSGRIKFLAINLDSAGYKRAIVDEVVKHPQPWAQVIAAGQQDDLFSDLGPALLDRPVLMMADTTGTVRYAGPATGFIAPMLLGKFLGGDSIRPNAAEKAVQAAIPTDSNSLSVADSNSISQTKQTPAARTPTQQNTQPQSQYRELSEENAIAAERKLQYAKDLFMQLGRKPGLTYKRGVDLCREVMRDYPGSEYAEQARQLLRQVPENQRSRYGITDQELGL